MANPKNTERRKRKYANQEARTAKNKAASKERGERRIARLLERTRSLIGKTVVARTASGPISGKVVDVINPGSSEGRAGSWLEIEGPRGNFKVSRSRVKVNV